MIANEQDPYLTLTHHMRRHPPSKQPDYSTLFPMHLAEQDAFVRIKSPSESGFKYRNSPLMPSLDELAQYFPRVKCLDGVSIYLRNPADPAECSKVVKDRLNYSYILEWKINLTSVIEALSLKQKIEESNKFEATSSTLAFRNTGRKRLKVMGFKKLFNEFSYLDTYLNFRFFVMYSYALIPFFELLCTSALSSAPTPKTYASKADTVFTVQEQQAAQDLVTIARMGASINEADTTVNNLFDKISQLLKQLPPTYKTSLFSIGEFTKLLNKMPLLQIGTLNTIKDRLGIGSINPGGYAYTSSLAKKSNFHIAELSNFFNNSISALFFGSIAGHVHSVSNYGMKSIANRPLKLEASQVVSPNNIFTGLYKRYIVDIDEGVKLVYGYYGFNFYTLREKTELCDTIKMPGASMYKDIVKVERMWSDSPNHLASGGVVRVYLSQFGKYAKASGSSATSSTLYLIEVRKYPLLSPADLAVIKQANSMLDDHPSTKTYLFMQTPSALYLAKASHSHTPVVPFKMGSYGVAEHPSSGTALVFATNGQQHGFAKIPVSKPSPYKSPASEPLFTTLSPTLQLAPVKLEIPKAAKNSADGQFMQKLKRNTHIESISINSRSVLVVTTTEIARSDIQRPMLVYSLDLAEMNNVVYNPALLNFRNSVSAKTFCVNDRLFAIVLHTRPPAYTIVSLSLNGKNIQACGKIAVKVTMPRCVTETMDWDEAQNCLAVWGLYHGKQSTELSLVLRTYKLVV